MTVSKNDSLLNSSPFYGAALIVLIAVIANIGNSLTHSLPKNLSSSQILFFKSSLGFIFVVIWFKGNLPKLLTTSYFRWQFFKGLTGAIGGWFWIAAVQVLPLADSSALSLTSALMTTVGAYYFFSEKPTKPLLSALAVGFTGVILILKPSRAVLQVYSFYPLLSALAFSTSSLIIKKVSLKDSSRTTLCYLLLFMALFSGGPAFYYWQPIEIGTLLKLSGIACLYTLSQLALIEAYTYTQAAFLAPFKFSRFPIAIIFGWLFFGEQFSWSTLMGGSLIIASYFYLAARVR
jgi:drug/metabolite transporter (DMT)-like permease